jgi:hypothetical protein
MANYTHNEIPGSPTTPWYEIFVSPVGSLNNSVIVLNNADGSETRLFSSLGNFSYNQITDELSGTVTSLARTGTNGSPTYEFITDISLSAYDLYETPNSAAAAALIFAGNDTFNGWSGADSMKGFAGADSMNGIGGNDTIDGGSGNDTLDGGSGSDRLDGGADNDIIYWDSGDQLAFVLGGTGTDMLMVVNQAAPTTFDLAAQGFENATVITNDSGGNWWSQITDYYNASWQRTNSDTVADNGNKVQTTYDVSPGGTGVNWQYISDYRNASNVLTNQDGKFDNDGTFAKSYDYAAGTGTDGISDELREFTYFFRNVTEQQSGSVLNVEGFYDDGRKFTQTNDIDGNQGWQYQTNWYETDGVTLDFLEIKWDDGSTQIIPY